MEELLGNSSVFYGGDMIKKIPRNKVNNKDRNIRYTNEQFRQRISEKVELIMDKLDEIVDELNR